MTRTAREIAALAARLGILPEGAQIRIERTRAGYWQRSAGAWSWLAVDEKNGRELFGSDWPASEVVKAGKENRAAAYTNDYTMTVELIVENREAEEL